MKEIAFDMSKSELEYNFTLEDEAATLKLGSDIAAIPPSNWMIALFGDLGIGNQDALVCTYFNGRKIIEYVFWYSPSNFLGKSECLFFFK